MLRSGKAAAMASAGWLLGAFALHGLTPAFFFSIVVFAYGLSLAAWLAPAVTLANLVTSVRFALVAWAAGSSLGSWSPEMWLACAIALCLDGVDGWVARSRNESTSFGARFDMEVDAVFISLLAFLAWRETGVGPWVLAIGLLRYAFVAASIPFPQLERPLPPSFFRKGVCVLQVLALLTSLAPWENARAWASPLLAVSLVLLGLSFAIDVVWCLVTDDSEDQLEVASSPS